MPERNLFSSEILWTGILSYPFIIALSWHNWSHRGLCDVTRWRTYEDLYAVLSDINGRYR